MLNPNPATIMDAQNWDELEADMLASDDYDLWLLSLAPDDEAMDAFW